MNFFTNILGFFSFLLVFLIPQNAHGYLDPGSGSFIIQMLIASFAGITYMVRAYIAQAYYFVKYRLLGLSKDTSVNRMDNVESDETE